jgi:hypothetical protein
MGMVPDIVPLREGGPSGKDHALCERGAVLQVWGIDRRGLGGRGGVLVRIGPGQPSRQGFVILIPVPWKSLTLRVASIALLLKQMAAI